ncbi:MULTISPECIES: hypothetical protein [Pseudomonas]|uniref:hypothetical protein n=1 Tax=Pseudomonas TaxID=286 RepID=UPI000AECD37A|nr:MULTISPECIES: hypothetical protein [Pseudomonas]PYB93439.1 hypothetical protein DMX01_02580 [Pseudomonas fulva]PYC16265.1 hypothetical protein DMX00_04170 [Pseudomonas fulva]UNT12022.1 hypothetical protein MOP87_13000 [Pseudomonas sp. I3-I5]
MWSKPHYRKLVRISGYYDLLMTIGFATPWTFVWLHGWLGNMHASLGLYGELPVFEPMHLLMANLMGSIVCVWAWLRIRHPQVRFGRYDAAGRVLFSSWQLYALMHGGSALIWGILVMEVVWAILQLMPVTGRRQTLCRTPAAA